MKLNPDGDMLIQPFIPSKMSLLRSGALKPHSRMYSNAPEPSQRQLASTYYSVRPQYLRATRHPCPSGGVSIRGHPVAMGRLCLWPLLSCHSIYTCPSPQALISPSQSVTISGHTSSVLLHLHEACLTTTPHPLWSH